MKKRARGGFRVWSGLPAAMRCVVGSFLEFKDLAPIPFVCKAWCAPMDCSSFRLHYTGDSNTLPSAFIDPQTVRDLVVARSYSHGNFRALTFFPCVKRLVFEVGPLRRLDLSRLEHLELRVRYTPLVLQLKRQLSQLGSLRNLILTEVQLSDLRYVADVLEALHHQRLSCSLYVRESDACVIHHPQLAADLDRLQLLQRVTFFLHVDCVWAVEFTKRKLQLGSLALQYFSLENDRAANWLVHLSTQQCPAELVVGFPHVVFPNKPDVGPWQGLRSLTVGAYNCVSNFVSLFGGANLRSLTLRRADLREPQPDLTILTLEWITLDNVYGALRLHAPRLAQADLCFTDVCMKACRWGPVVFTDSSPACRIQADALHLSSFDSFTRQNRLESLELFVFLPGQAPQGLFDLRLPRKTSVNASFLPYLRDSVVRGLHEVAVLESCTLARPFYRDFVSEQIAVHVHNDDLRARLAVTNCAGVWGGGGRSLDQMNVCAGFFREICR